tara:strand:+ start:1039 stop:1674 length:636 start_codon:yes stop_codon:yes gene_type:complete
MIMTEFTHRETASHAVAKYLFEHLEAQLAAQPRAMLMASGGSSPQQCLIELSAYPLDWSRVDVTLTDERLVPVTDEASNERMVRATLFTGAAKSSTFCQLSNLNVSLIASALPVTLVGMGEDGHFASIFPDLTELDSLVDIDAAPACKDVITSASPVPRCTANLSLLLRSRAILLLVFGDKKKQVLEAADGLPVSHLVNQSRVPVEVYWAP